MRAFFRYLDWFLLPILCGNVGMAAAAQNWGLAITGLTALALLGRLLAQPR